MRRALLFLVCTLLTAPIWGQSSGSFRIEQSQMNAGGRPAQGQAAASASFRIGLDTIAGSAPVAAASPSFAIESGFAGLYRPVGEVTGLLFTSNDALTWSNEAAALRYNVYRDGCRLNALAVGHSPGTLPFDFHIRIFPADDPSSFLDYQGTTVYGIADGGVVDGGLGKNSLVDCTLASGRIFCRRNVLSW